MSNKEQEANSAFVIGWPIEHSRSPLLHGYWLKYLKIPGTYEAVAIRVSPVESDIKWRWKLL